MNRIADLLPRTNVAVGVDAATKRDLFVTIAGLFEASGGIQRAAVVDALSAREKLGSTGLGQGIAIPHGRIKGLKDARGAFVRLAQPIPFDAPDGRPVNQVFVLLVPEQATEQHLELLSDLAQMFSERAFREQLAAAPDAAATWQAISAWAPVA
ncbi:PTS system, galactitol-specific IIA component [Burkholderiales bacterium]|nr:PTS system, galactitol-specific IIA component [Burkholderiales bacterium]